MAIYLNSLPVDLNAKFPDGTFAFKVPKEEDDLGMSFLTWKYESEEELIALYFLVRQLRQCDPDRNLYLTMYYVPNARMDRTKYDDEVFTLKYFADFINSLQLTSVEILDPHSSVTPALLNNVRVLSAQPLIDEAIRHVGADDLVLFYPDEGAMKRYSSLLKMPYGFGVKYRAWRSGQIISYRIEGDIEFKGKKVLIVDDICCRGGTFYHAAKLLQQEGVSEINLYCTHCEETIFQGELLNSDMIHHIYTTNSLFDSTHPKITVFDCEKILLEHALGRR